DWTGVSVYGRIRRRGFSAELERLQSGAGFVARVWRAGGAGKRRRRFGAGGGGLGRGARETAAGLRHGGHGERRRHRAGWAALSRSGPSASGGGASCDRCFGAAVHLRISRLLGGAGDRPGDGGVVQGAGGG